MNPSADVVASLAPIQGADLASYERRLLVVDKALEAAPTEGRREAVRDELLEFGQWLANDGTRLTRLTDAFEEDEPDEFVGLVDAYLGVAGLNASESPPTEGSCACGHAVHEFSCPGTGSRVDPCHCWRGRYRPQAHLLPKEPRMTSEPKPTTPVEALRLLVNTANTLIVRSAFADKTEQQHHIVELDIAVEHARSALCAHPKEDDR